MIQLVGVLNAVTKLVLDAPVSTSALLLLAPPSATPSWDLDLALPLPSGCLSSSSSSEGAGRSWGLATATWSRRFAPSDQNGFPAASAGKELAQESAISTNPECYALGLITWETIRGAHLFLIHLQKGLRCRSWSLQEKGSKQNVGEIRMDTSAWWHKKSLKWKSHLQY